MTLTITHKHRIGRPQRRSVYDTKQVIGRKVRAKKLYSKEIIILKSIQKAGEKAAAKAKKTMGYAITQNGNWIVKTDAKGNIVQKIVQIEKISTPKVILLD